MHCPRRTVVERSRGSPETPLKHRREIVGGMRSATPNEDSSTPRPETPPRPVQDSERQEHVPPPARRERLERSVAIARHEPLPAPEPTVSD
jgi:hypothetical protein